MRPARRGAESRPLLFSIAYGMTGSAGDAEDVVQDAFLGLTRARQAGTTITDPKAYLTAAVTRLGINYLSSVRVRRETYVGDWLPEPIVVPAGGPGPAEHAELADSLSMAFLVLLEPSRRAAGGVHAARGVRVQLPGCGQDHRQDRGELPADLRPRQAAHLRRRAGAPQRSLPGVGRKARNSPAGSSRPPTSADGVVQAIRAVVNPDKLGHIGPVSDVARLPEKELPQHRHNTDEGETDERLSGYR